MFGERHGVNGKARTTSRNLVMFELDQTGIASCEYHQSKTTGEKKQAEQSPEKPVHYQCGGIQIAAKSFTRPKFNFRIWDQRLASTALPGSSSNRPQRVSANQSARLEAKQRQNICND